MPAGCREVDQPTTGISWPSDRVLRELESPGICCQCCLCSTGGPQIGTRLDMKRENHPTHHKVAIIGLRGF